MAVNVCAILQKDFIFQKYVIFEDGEELGKHMFSLLQSLSENGSEIS